MDRGGHFHDRTEDKPAFPGAFSRRLRSFAIASGSAKSEAETAHRPAQKIRELGPRRRARVGQPWRSAENGDCDPRSSDQPAAAATATESAPAAGADRQ